MEYLYAPYNPEQYATNLLTDQSRSRLKWENSNGQEVLILQTPFGCNGCSDAKPLLDKDGTVIEAVCRALGEMELNENDFNEVFPGVWVRFVTAAAKARLQGCPLHGEASTYSVFACSRKEDVCTVYAPQIQAMISPFCDVPLEASIEICRDTYSVRRMFRTVEQETGFFRITFPEELAQGFVDGTIQLCIGDTRIPITQKAIETGTVYVKTEVKPELQSSNKGLKLK